MRRHFDLKWLFAIPLGALALSPESPINGWVRFDVMAQTSDIRNTRHNLGSGGAGTTKTTATAEVCVFCHTPHGSIIGAVAPLWNRAGSAASAYTPYSSLSLDGTALATPGDASKMCLSCHDGTLAPGSGLSNTPGSGTAGPTAVMTMPGVACAAPGVTTGTNCISTGSNSGYTRNLGTNLANDHPIALAFTSTVATNDTELKSPPYTNGSLIVALRATGVKPKLPLMGTTTTNQSIECNTCHDPHLKAADAGTTNIAGTVRDAGKFLRMPRFQQAAIGTTHVITTDQICISCHTKTGWVESAHVHNDVANEVYDNITGGGADQREFPRGTTVRQAGCLNCHDTHTQTGARRLLRNGANAGASAIENTCFQCHNTAANSVLGALAGNIGLRTQTGAGTVQVPDIATEFGKAVRMPLVVTPEVHEIRNSDFEECPNDLGAKGAGALPGTGSALTTCGSMALSTNAKRHVECTDCHNPHRVRRGALFSTASSETDGTAGRYRTHIPASGTNGVDGNVISGALRGAWGVQPIWPATVGVWPEVPTSFVVKKGDPGSGTTVGTYTRSVDSTPTYLNREFQLCFKCHSNYATDTFPNLVGGGGTASGTNGMLTFTNTAAEFAVNATSPPSTLADQGEYGESTTVAVEDSTAIEPAGSAPADTVAGTMSDIAGTQNHRSWHPVVFPTGRTKDERRISSTTSNFQAPWYTNLGTQTMHCSDCHGSDGSWTAGTGPNLSRTQGPHGSAQPFLLKGAWTSLQTPAGPGVCGNCHNPTAGTSGTGDASTRPSGFNDPGNDGGGGHGNSHGDKSCMRCHVAVPHGWKNKAFLVNLNCIGPEGGQAGPCTSSASNNLTVAPYYNGARLRVQIWQPSGNWTFASCGGNSWMNTNCG